MCIFTAAATGAVRWMSHEVKETDEEFDARYVAFFSRPDIDGWEVRKVCRLGFVNCCTFFIQIVKFFVSSTIIGNE